MRDITKDLRQRVSEIDIEIGKTQSFLEDLTNRKKNLKALLDAEENRWRNQRPTLFPELPSSLSDESKRLPPLSQFLLDSLKDGGKTIEALKKAVKENSVPITAKKPGRGISVALIRLSLKGLTEKKDNIWRLKGNTATVAGREGLRASQ